MQAFNINFEYFNANKTNYDSVLKLVNDQFVTLWKYIFMTVILALLLSVVFVLKLGAPQINFKAKHMTLIQCFKWIASY